MFYCSSCDSRIEWGEENCPNCGAVLISRESYERTVVKDAEDYKELVNMKGRLAIRLFFLVLLLFIGLIWMLTFDIEGLTTLMTENEGAAVFALIAGCSVFVIICVEVSKYLDVKDRIRRMDSGEYTSHGEHGVVYAYLYEKTVSTAEAAAPSGTRPSEAKPFRNKQTGIKKPLRSYEIYCYNGGTEANKRICAFCDGENEKGSANCQICGYSS